MRCRAVSATTLDLEGASRPIYDDGDPISASFQLEILIEKI